MDDGISEHEIVVSCLMCWVECNFTMALGRIRYCRSCMRHIRSGLCTLETRSSQLEGDQNTCQKRASSDRVTSRELCAEVGSSFVVRREPNTFCSTTAQAREWLGCLLCRSLKNQIVRSKGACAFGGGGSGGKSWAQTRNGPTDR